MIDLISPPNSIVKAALYYIRLDTHGARALFADADASKISFAQIAADELLAAAKRKGILLNQWGVAPDGIYAVVSIQDNRPEDHQTGKPRLLTSFVAGVKAATAKRINLVRNQPGCPVWKRSYKEQKIEDDRMLSRLSEQIRAAETVVMSQ